MNIYSLIAGVAAPTDLWNNLIGWLHGSIGNIGWAILVLTLLVKLATSPLDFMVKLSTKKQTLVQQKCAPQVAKLQKKFGNDKQRLQIQTNALYKREGLNAGVSCIVMLINLVLTCTIFFTFFASLRTTSAYQVINQYETVHSSYETAFTNHIIDNSTYTADTAPEFIEKFDADYVLVETYEKNQAIVNNSTDETSQEFIDANAYINNAENQTNYALAKNNVDSNKDLFEDATVAGSEAALETWNESKSTWLWIQNIWVADAPINNFPTYSELQTTASNANSYYKDYVASIDETEYNNIALIINSNQKSANGYYILAILAGVITFLAQYITDLHNKLKNKKAKSLADSANPQAASMKILKFVMPVIMVMFVLTSTASFGIYLLASNIAGIVVGEFINLFVNLATKKKRLEVEEALEKEADRLIKKGKLQG